MTSVYTRQTHKQAGRQRVLLWEYHYHRSMVYCLGDDVYISERVYIDTYLLPSAITIDSHVYMYIHVGSQG